MRTDKEHFFKSIGSCSDSGAVWKVWLERPELKETGRTAVISIEVIGEPVWSQESVSRRNRGAMKALDTYFRSEPLKTGLEGLGFEQSGFIQWVFILLRFQRTGNAAAVVSQTPGCVVHWSQLDGCFLDFETFFTSDLLFHFSTTSEV